MSNCLLPDEAHAVWDLLVEGAGAPSHPEYRHAFVAYMTVEDAAHEYRFGGLLGFGGKLYLSSRGAYVSYYREHRTEAREVIVAAVNARLDEMLSGVRR